ncbi:hypothetical protein D9M72_567270 [compost metagenome]
MIRRISWGSFLMTPISWRVSSSEAAMFSDSFKERVTKSCRSAGEMMPGGDDWPPAMNSSMTSWGSSSSAWPMMASSLAGK